MLGFKRSLHDGAGYAGFQKRVLHVGLELVTEFRKVPYGPFTSSNGGLFSDIFCLFFDLYAFVQTIAHEHCDYDHLDIN